MTSPPKLTIDEFLEAFSGAEERYELVGGFVRQLVRGNQDQNVIRANVLAALVSAGKREGYRTTLLNTGVRTGADTVRYPDVVVDGGPPDGDAMTASKPAVIVEVFPSAASGTDRNLRLREYQSLERVETVLQIAADALLVQVHRRRQDGAWSAEVVEDPDAVIPLPPLAASISPNDIYDTLEVGSRPRNSVGSRA